MFSSLCPDVFLCFFVLGALPLHSFFLGQSFFLSFVNPVAVSHCSLLIVRVAFICLFSAVDFSVFFALIN